MPQTVLPFKLDTTSETLTPHAGLVLVGEFAQALGFSGLIDRHLPAPGSAAGYRPSQFVLPLTLMLHGGGRSLEDLREIRQDGGLRDLLEMEQIPSSDATGDWLRRMGDGAGLEGLASANRTLVQRGLKRDGLNEYTLDIDATQIVAEKQEARWTYKGERGYMPMVGHLAENGLCVGDEFREGNEAPQARNLEFIQYCAARMPKGKRIAHLRSDSAAYQARVFNGCEKTGISFAIGADLDSAVNTTIAAIPEEDWKVYQDGHIAETVHSMNETHKAFRLVVIRRPVQRALFEEKKEGEEALPHRYKAIASNRIENAEATAAWYNLRGETSENRIKELKLGFGMERMPCGTFGANAAFFRVGILSYNLFILFKKMALPNDWRKHQVQTLRWRLYQTAGKVAHHGRQMTLRIASRMFELFEEVRIRCREVSLA